MKNKTLFAIFIALFSCAIWAGSFIIARGVHEWIPPVTLAFWRWMVALIVLTIISYKNVIREKEFIIKHWKYIVFMGFLSVGVFNTLIYTAAHYTTAHHIALISSISPVGTLLIAIFLGFEKFSKISFLGAVTAFFGALIIISSGNLMSLIEQKWNKGDIILLVSAMIWAGWSAFLHYKPKELSPKSFLTTQAYVGIIALLPLYIWECIYVAPTPFTLNAWLIYIYLGVGSSCIAWIGWQVATAQLGAVKVSLVYYTIPIFSSILAVMILGESFKLYHLVGFIAIFMGILLSNLQKKF